ncbi:MAG: DNA polymerase III subunit delta' [Acidobacteriota bacterium]
MPFKDIVGHGPVVELLRQAARRGRVPQSLIFAGPDGVGKRAVATALAQAVSCPKRADGDACGTCSVCVRIAGQRFPDVTWLDKGDYASIKIDALREQILQAVGYRPFEGPRRIFIINEADDLTVQAQDALLKTLEEPPSATILILITAYPDTLLATIQSRCRRLRFGLLPEADVARILVSRAGIEPSKAHRLALVSGGSVARALSDDTGYFEEDRDLALGLLRARGAAMPERMKAAAAFAQHDNKRRAREAASTRLTILVSLLRDLSVLAAADPVPLANADLDDELRRVLRAYDPHRLVDAFDAIGRASTALDRNASPKIVADWLAATL